MEEVAMVGLIINVMPGRIFCMIQPDIRSTLNISGAGRSKPLVAPEYTPSIRYVDWDEKK